MKLASVIPILAATVLLAQTPQQPAAAQGTQAGRAKEALKTALGLSDQQIEQLTALRKEERQALQPARQQMQQAQKALRDAMAAGTSDPAAIGKVTLQLRDLRQQVQQTNQTYHDRALGLLDDAQKTKVQNLQAAMQRLGRMRPAIAAAGARVRARVMRRAIAGQATQ